MPAEILVRYTPSAMHPIMKTRFSYTVLLIAAASSLACTSLFAQSSTPATSRAAAVLDSMPHAKRISDVALSPDGTQVAYIVDKKLTVTNVAGQSSQAIAVEGGLPIRNVAWSADGKRIAFIADLPGDVPSAQIWTAAADGSTPMKHVELKGYVQAPRFSPGRFKARHSFH